jgi:hypothetical protein
LGLILEHITTLAELPITDFGIKDKSIYSLQERLIGEILQIERRAAWILTSMERQPS